MLRFSFLPSDFHPMVLILGEASDLKVLTRGLREFARSSSNVKLHETAGFAPSDTQLTLVSAAVAEGVRPVSVKDKVFRWVLDAEAAEYFADLVDELTQPDVKSGSQRLECELMGEIPVKISRGEFTDAFLVLSPGRTDALAIR